MTFPLDMNECTTDDYKCHPEANCENTARSFQCSCKPGFIGNGYECFGKNFSIRTSLAVPYSACCG